MCVRSCVLSFSRGIVRGDVRRGEKGLRLRGIAYENFIPRDRRSCRANTEVRLYLVVDISKIASK